MGSAGRLGAGVEGGLNRYTRGPRVRALCPSSGAEKGVRSLSGPGTHQGCGIALGGSCLVGELVGDGFGGCCRSSSRRRRPSSREGWARCTLPPTA